MLPILIIIII